MPHQLHKAIALGIRFNFPPWCFQQYKKKTESLTLKNDEMLLGPENHHLNSHLLYLDFENSYTLAVQIQTILVHLVSLKPTKQCPKKLSQMFSRSKSSSKYTNAKYKFFLSGRNFSCDCVKMIIVPVITCPGMKLHLTWITLLSSISP